MGRRRRDAAFYEGFGKTLDQLMAQRGLRPVDLAKRMKVSESTVSRWRRGAVPDPDALKVLVRTLRTTSDVLFGISAAAHAKAPLDPVVVQRLEKLAVLLESAGRETRQILSSMSDDDE